MAKVEVKSVLKSKTFYFGILSILLAVANLFGYGDYQPEGYANEALELVNGLAIIALRFKTNSSVKL